MTVKVTVFDKYPPLDAIVAETIEEPTVSMLVSLPEIIDITVGLVRTLYVIAPGLSLADGFKKIFGSPKWLKHHRM